MLDKASLGERDSPRHPTGNARRADFLMLSIAIRFIRRSAAIWLAAWMLICVGSVVAETASVQQLDRLVSASELDNAVTVARALELQAELQLDLTLPLARLARALERAEDLGLAAEFYQRSVDASTRPAAATLAAGKANLLRLAAGTLLTRTNRLAEAVAALRPLLADDGVATEEQQQIAVSICLRIGAMALSRGDNVTASEAYALALSRAGENQRVTAMLGDAWVTALRNEDPLEAARKLSAFIENYPQHADAAQAARASAECFQRAGHNEDAAETQAKLLQIWPDSESARAVVREHCKPAVDFVPAPVRDWLIRKANAKELEDFDASMTTLGISVATQQNELRAWTNLVNHLAATDQSGQATSDLLVALVDAGKQAEAERLATLVIAPLEDAVVTAGVREAACRWAGRTLRWSMLAFASESEMPEQPNSSRSIAVETLFAEALMQTGRIEEARRWWDHLVDARQVDRFSTLLRCAEAETAVGFDASRSAQRIAAARQSAGDDRFNISLVDLLEAELSVRRTEFDQARALLENVIRSSEAVASVRGRAQWLIGETHYLQQQFHEAIEAYRRVEGIDPQGDWVSLSILQAGKSFEQLGRTREAAVCYGNLLRRFSGSSHAEHARRRLASINSDANPPQADSSPRSIRR
jgi:TolA-binding protein